MLFVLMLPRATIYVVQDEAWNREMYLVMEGKILFENVLKHCWDCGTLVGTTRHE